MPLFHIFVLAVIQGLTEFLPVSSSGHLVILPHLMGWADQGQILDVAVHLGTLVAVVGYFRRDVARALVGFGQILRGNLATSEAFLALCLILATLPVVALGLVFKLSGLDEALRSITVIGWSMVIFGLVLYWADHGRPETRKMEGWTLRHAVHLGLWQAVALIPGTSRSGICITGARLLGYGREDAARIAMLMSIPTILAAGALSGAQVIGTADWAMLRDAAIAAVFACGAALIALSLMMRFLRSYSYTPYVIYRIILGVILLAIAYT